MLICKLGNCGMQCFSSIGKFSRFGSATSWVSLRQVAHTVSQSCHIGVHLLRANWVHHDVRESPDVVSMLAWSQCCKSNHAQWIAAEFAPLVKHWKACGAWTNFVHHVGVQARLQERSWSYFKCYNCVCSLGHMTVDTCVVSWGTQEHRVWCSRCFEFNLDEDCSDACQNMVCAAVGLAWLGQVIWNGSVKMRVNCDNENVQ